MTKIIAFDKERRSRRLAVDTRARARSGNGAGADPNPGASKTTSLRVARHGERSNGVSLTVSVVIPTRRRPQLLNRCMAALVLQRFDSAQYEIIVVDDGPDESTREVVAEWATHCAGSGPAIVYIPSMGPHGPAAARNLGWRAARSEIVAFTDDDTVPRADWLRNGLRAFDEHVHALSGRIVMPLSGTPTDYELDAKNLEQTEFVTANCFCRKRVLEDLGGFDERFLTAWREDSDFHFRLLEYGAAVHHASDAVVMHPIRPAPWGVSLAQVRKVQFDALLYKKHPSLYRRRIRAAPRWDFYLLVGALIACIVALLAGAMMLSTLFSAIWLLGTARFCWLRLRKTSKAPAHVAEMVVTSILIPPLAVFWRIVGAVRFRAALL